LTYRIKCRHERMYLHPPGRLCCPVSSYSLDQMPRFSPGEPPQRIDDLLAQAVVQSLGICRINRWDGIYLQALPIRFAEHVKRTHRKGEHLEDATVVKPSSQRAAVIGARNPIHEAPV